MRNIVKWWKNLDQVERERYKILYALVIWALFCSFFLGGGIRRGNWEDFWMAIGTNLVGVAVTFVLINMFLGNIEKRDAEKQELDKLRRNLIRDMGSSDNGIALQSINAIRDHGWIRDELLQKRVFEKANWEGADLSGFDLRGSAIIWSNLRNAHFYSSELDGTNFNETDLCEAQGLEAASFSNIGMPDGDLYKDKKILPYFTDPKHTPFWRSTDPLSPAYVK